jgi:hypothetical protein
MIWTKHEEDSFAPLQLATHTTRQQRNRGTKSSCRGATPLSTKQIMFCQMSLMISLTTKMVMMRTFTMSTIYGIISGIFIWE